MKELSIEQKAKAYDEAIKKAESLYKAAEPMSGCNVIIETLFPELKESDDERIREKVIATIHLYYGEPLEDEAKEMIAWLEKQGEQKPNPCDGCTNRKGCINCENGELRETEQKPVEWSEEDEKKRNLLISILNVNHPNGYFKVNPANTLNMEAIYTEELVAWLKSLRPQNRWKPSDEQMIALRQAISGCSYDIEPLVEIEEYLKKLK